MNVQCEVSFGLSQSLVNKEVSAERLQFFSSIPAYLNKQPLLVSHKILGSAGFVCGVLYVMFGCVCVCVL